MDNVAPRPFDLLDVPVVGRLLRWRHARTFLQIPLLALSVVMVLHGLFGPSLAPKNLATTLVWLHFRGVLVLVLLCAGNFFCFVCPFMLVRQVARRLFQPWLAWPRKLRNKWLSAGLFVLILFLYELFDLWSSPWWTAWLIVAYFVAVLVVDGVFKHAAFCKFVCPIGQFNFAASTLSPLEVKVRDQEVCADCVTRDCIRGRRDPASELVVVQRGCELALFQPRKSGNMDCTFCLDCVHACPHDNVGILSRVPASELMGDPFRSGIGYFSRRKDLAALAIVFTFGALLNAFGMVSPVYAVESWMARMLHVTHEAPVLGLVFTAFLVAEPVLLLGVAAWITRTWAGSRRAMPALMTRYSYGLAPLGFGMWLAHYSFHFFTGLYTAIPITQNAIASLGRAYLGEPRWTLTGLPLRAVQPLQVGFLMLGLTGSLLVTHRLAQDDCGDHPMRAFVPWAAVCLLIWVGAIWLIFQPMEMRATFMTG
ncbi:MAG: FesM [Acidobacteriia bacterium]|nr:FesM [Terriglobia bacterium]